jgi:hypothetical protein
MRYTVFWVGKPSFRSLDLYAITLTAQPGVVVQLPPKEEIMACKMPKKAAKKPAPKKK